MATVAHLLKQKGNLVFAVSPEDTVMTALQVMAEKNIGAVLVMRGAQVVGIFSERDYARRGVLIGNSEATPIQELMSTTVYFVSPDESIGNCLTQMTEKHVRHLPIIKDSKLVGLISIGDVVKAIIAEKQSTIVGLENFLVSKDNPY
ncbi:MAG: CBS domain-containing protein [Anaerolineaceae bacterium]